MTPTYAQPYLHTPRLGISVFLLTFAIYAALAPWMVRVWQRTGDEPHYLLAAHSLAYDGDFDLGNNYARRDYLSFYGVWNLTPHTRPGPSGQAVLTHNLGLSLLIAPAYRLGGLAGVEYFLAALGALLAANVFMLGYEITYHVPAAAIGWVVVSFTPPVLWYVFLVYPEMVAGLCIIFTLRHLLYPHAHTPMPPGTFHPSTFHPVRAASPPGRDGLPPSPSRLAACALCLAFLPWLSSRYLPVFGLLILGALLRAVRDRSRGWLLAALGGLAGLGAYALFSLWLYGNASPAASYAGPTPLAVEESFALVRFARGVFGWLVDNQRGLLITAPIYIAALWGGASLLRRDPIVGSTVLLPFVMTLIPIAVWGGFWIGWEHSARFLVAALPPLGGAVAYLWAAGRRAIVIPVSAILLGLSLAFGRAVIAQPLTGIFSSPIEMLKPRIDLEAFVPAMAGYAFIPAGHEAVVGAAGGLGWRAQAGESGLVLRQVDVPEFPFGWYAAWLPMQAPGAAPDTPVANVKVFSPRGGNYFSQTVYGRDLARGVFVFSFKSPLYDGWAFPPTVLVSSTGQADLSLGMLTIEPESFHSLILPALWLAILAITGLVVVSGAREPRPWPLVGVWPLTMIRALAALAALASLGWSLQPQPRTYATVDLERNVGVIVADPRAYGGAAMEASPDAGQEAGMLAVTLPEIYAPGRYRLTLSLRALPTDFAPDPSLSVADVRLFSSEVEKFARLWEVYGADLPADGQYHRFAFEFDNPRQQALIFILDYPAAAGLRADVIRVEPLR